MTIDRFGRKVPKSAVGSIGLGDFTSSSARIREAMTMLYERIVDSRLLVRRLTVIADDVATPEELAPANAMNSSTCSVMTGPNRMDPIPPAKKMESMISSVRCWM